MFPGLDLQSFNKPSNIGHIVLRIRWRQRKENFFDGGDKQPFFFQAFKIHVLNRRRTPWRNLQIHNTFIHCGFYGDTNNDVLGDLGPKFVRGAARVPGLRGVCDDEAGIACKNKPAIR